MKSNSVSPILGTAMWGWTTPKKVCFQLLDEFYQQGFRQVDGATNYPINQNLTDWRAAEKILQEWINTNGIHDLKVMIKTGSLNNLKTPDHNLTKSFLLMNFDEYHSMFGSNLNTFMIHWDNREDKEAIFKTFEALQIIHNQGLTLGFSGIKHPAIYADLNKKFNLTFRIQMKHNLLHSDYDKYHFFHSQKQFIAYGINAGGIKLESNNYTTNSSLKARAKDWTPPVELIEKAMKIIKQTNENTTRPKLSTFNHLGMIYAFYHEGIEAILLGTSKVPQLNDSIQFMQQMELFDYSDVFKRLKNNN